MASDSLVVIGRQSISLAIVSKAIKVCKTVDRIISTWNLVLAIATPPVVALLAQALASSALSFTGNQSNLSCDKARSNRSFMEHSVYSSTFELFLAIKPSRNEAQTAGIYLLDALFQRVQLSNFWDVERIYTWV